VYSFSTGLQKPSYFGSQFLSSFHDHFDKNGYTEIGHICHISSQASLFPNSSHTKYEYSSTNKSSLSHILKVSISSHLLFFAK
jgi:type II restriction/modification system DNA methylase subunit YeeA